MGRNPVRTAPHLAAHSTLAAALFAFVMYQVI